MENSSLTDYEQEKGGGGEKEENNFYILFFLLHNITVVYIVQRKKILVSVTLSIVLSHQLVPAYKSMDSFDLLSSFLSINPSRTPALVRHFFCVVSFLQDRQCCCW